MLLNDAINICLRYIGETPVPDGVDIDSLDPLHEAVITRDIIKEVSKEAQSVGWWFNKETWVFQPDALNRIGISPTVISLQSDKDVIQRGGSLYDRQNQTYEFTEAVTANVIWEWDFEELPSTFATYVTYLAAQQVQLFLNGDETTNKDLERRLAIALTKVEKEHLRNSKFNLIKNKRLIDRTSVPTGI